VGVHLLSAFQKPQGRELTDCSSLCVGKVPSNVRIRWGDPPKLDSLGNRLAWSNRDATHYQHKQSWNAFFGRRDSLSFQQSCVSRFYAEDTDFGPRARCPRQDWR